MKNRSNIKFIFQEERLLSMLRRRFEDVEAGCSDDSASEDVQETSDDAHFIDDSFLFEEDSLDRLLADEPVPSAPLRAAAPSFRAAAASPPGPGPAVAVRSAAPPVPNISRDELGEDPPETGRTRKRQWCFTLNSVAGAPLRAPWSALPPGARYLVFQEEVGDQGTHHYQGYIEFEKQVTLPAVKAALESHSVHLSHAYGDAKTQKEYCSKCCKPCYLTRKLQGFIGSIVDCSNCDRIAGPWEFGEAVTQGVRARVLQKVADQGYHQVLLTDPAGLAGIHKVAQEYDRALRRAKRDAEGWKPVEIRVYTGPRGTGKSRAFWDSAPVGDRYKVAQHNKSGVWFDGYHGQKWVLIEEFHSSVPINSLLDWLDGHPSTDLPVKCSFEPNSVEVWYLCTNVEPHLWYPGVPKEVLQALFRRIYLNFGIHLRWSSEENDFVRIMSEPFSNPALAVPSWEKYTYGLSPSQVADYLSVRHKFDSGVVPRVPDSASMAGGSQSASASRTPSGYPDDVPDVF